jgi:hypothetical protein
MSRRPELPPKVEAHVQRQLVRADWDRLLRDLRTMCADCPADRDPDICVNCPLEGIAIDAATLTLRAQIAKLQKSKTRKKMGGQILNGLKDGQQK